MEQRQLDRMAHGLKNYNPNLLPRACAPQRVHYPERSPACVMVPAFAQQLRQPPGNYCVSRVQGPMARHLQHSLMRFNLSLPQTRARTCYEFPGRRPKVMTVGIHPHGFAPKRLVKVGSTLMEVQG